MRAPVDRERLERFIDELGRVAPPGEPARVYLVGGATAVLHEFRDSTIDVDLRIEPDHSPLLRALPPIKERLGINLELASPLDFLPELPGWRDRSRFVRQSGAVAVFELDYYAQALAKLERGHDRDLADVAAMRDEGLIDNARLLELLAAIEPELWRFPSISPAAFREDVERFVAGD